MIIGIGSDLCDIRRIEKSLERFGDRFTNKVFTEIERTRSERKPDRASSYAKRFAAKEACSKALGTGLKRGVHLAGMGVVNLPSGKPTLALTGGAAVRLAALVPEGLTPVIHLSLTDDHPYAQAFVIIEAIWGCDEGACFRKDGASRPVSANLFGFARIAAESLEGAWSHLTGNPVFEAGGTVEIRLLVEDE